MSVKTLYNPASLSKPELIESFVVRTKNFEKIFSDIKTSEMKYPEKHYLIQGQRGMGKTTLLLRLKYEVENSEELNKWLLPVFFSEESYDLTSLSGLWEKLLKFLDEEFDTNGKYFEHTEDFIDLDDYEKRCFDYLIEVLHKKGKKIILFFDNFGQLFLDNLKEKEKRRLREILMQCSDIRIVGASAIVLQDLHDYSQPFYEFFQIVHLDGLSKEETYQLIVRLQEGCENKIDLKKNKGKIDTLAILTGGVIRTLMMVYEVLLDDQDGSALSDLELILDQVTPLYKHRIEDLPPQQRRIVDVIAKRWDAISAKEIAAEIREEGKRMQTKLISAQLAQLERNNVVEKKQTNTKNHLYQLKERFFNIWYLMRNGDRRDRRKVKWLTKFLEMWYDDQESMESFLERHILRLQSGLYNSKSALLLADALVGFNKINAIKLDQMIEATSAILTEDQKPYFNYGQKKFALASRLFEEDKLAKAIDVLESIHVKSNSHIILLAFFYCIDNKIDMSKLALINVSEISIDDLYFLKDLSVLLEAPELFLDILDRSPKIGNLERIFSIGEVYLSLNNLDVAEDYFLNSLKLGDIKAYGPLSAIQIEKDEVLNAEEYLLTGYKLGGVRLFDVLDFYYINYKKPLLGKTKEFLSLIPKSDIYFNYYHGFEALSSLVHGGKDKEILEVNKYFENALLDLENAQMYDIRYHKVLSNVLIFNLLYRPSKEDIKRLSPKIECLENRQVPLNILYAFSLAWLGKFKEAIDILKPEEVIKSILNHEILCERFNETLLLLISKNQFYSVLDLFSKNENLREALKPTYYALMTLLKDEYPNEIIKMGEELAQPVNDVLKKIEEMKDEYK